ncbi:hypothetical protein ABFS82_10G017300 [Erythranthe guttata]
MAGRAASSPLINLKRARILVNSHVLHQKVPGISDCNRMENVLVWERFIRPKITFGVPLEEMVTGKKRGSVLRRLVKLYAEEKYFLAVNQMQTEFEVFVSFKEGATNVTVLRSGWQSYWLHQNRTRSDDEVLSQPEGSLIELKDKFDDFLIQVKKNDFLIQVKKSGWDTDKVNLKVPKEISIQEHLTL